MMEAHDGFTPHMHSNISPQSHSFVAKEAKFLRRLSLTCLKLSWSAWRFGKELVILNKCSDEDERKSHRVFPPRSFYPVPRPTSAGIVFRKL